MIFKKKPATREFGLQQEKLAASYLRRHKLHLLVKNYSCRVGEIDLIMEDATGLILFIEVRYRQQQIFGSALESVNCHKQRKIKQTAAHFIQHHPSLRNRVCRFDVVAVSPIPQSGKTSFEWIKNAFY